MSKNQKKAFIIILVAAAAVVFVMFRNIWPKQEANPVTVTRGGVPVATLDKKASDPARGNARASVTIFEFSDFGCEHCASMAPILKSLLATNDDVQLVWKDVAASRFPVPSINAHIAARCAQKQGKFWEYHDALFANQEQLGEPLYFNLATELQLNESTFETCYRAQAVKPLIDEGSILANAIGVSGTPYFVIGNERFSGVRSEAFMRQAIQKARN